SIPAGKIQAYFQQPRCQFQCVCFISRNSQVRVSLRMIAIQLQRPLVIQNCAPEIAVTEIGIAQVIEQICAPLARLDDRAVVCDCRLKISRVKFGVCFHKQVIVCRCIYCWRKNKKTEKERSPSGAGKYGRDLHDRLSINSKASRRPLLVSAPSPLPPPL